MPEITRDRCITPSFSPSTYPRRKLMDGEGCTLYFGKTAIPACYCLCELYRLSQRGTIEDVV